ncbi:hypothetical protein [Helicobacter sp. 16-1353]|uniref:hypothetical protein n=1 Tax=Helicobacter sp. 16-1353 TaxID=2004996 RepID=UPI0015EF3661|nr:hypothetical protein [Helicobacter sp. 16-1353]
MESKIGKINIVEFALDSSFFADSSQFYNSIIFADSNLFIDSLHYPAPPLL